MLVNMDVNSFNGLPEPMKHSFCNLLNHVSTINSRTEKLVLDLVKAIAEEVDTDDNNVVLSPHATPSNEHIPSPEAVNANNNCDFPDMNDFQNIDNLFLAVCMFYFTTYSLFLISFLHIVLKCL